MDLSNLSLASIRNQLDEVRAQVYPRNETERKVYDALSSKNWGASSTLLNDIAAESMEYEKFDIIMTVIWDNMDVDGRSWKQIFKTLTLIEFLIKNGSERVIEVTRNRMHKIRTLEDFSYFEGNVDKGSGVREKSKIICELLNSNDMLRSEREKARSLRNKFIGISNDGRNSGFGGGNNYDSNFSAGRYNDNSGGGGGNNTWSNNGGGGGGNSYSDSGSYDNRSSSYNSSQDHGNNRNNHNHSSNNSRSKENADYFEDVKAKSAAKTIAAKSVSTPPISTGKLKVSIKKAPTADSTIQNASAASHVATVASVVTNKSKPVEVDLFTFDDPVPITAAPAVPTSNATAFDPFNTSSAPVPQQQSQVHNNFDPFGSSAAPTPPRVPTSAPFDPFSAQPQQQQYVQAAVPTPPKPLAFDPFNAQPPPQQQQQYGQNNFNAVAIPVVNSTFDPFAAGNHQPQQPMSQFQSAANVAPVGNINQNMMMHSAGMYNNNTNTGPNPQGQIIQPQQQLQQPQQQSFVALQQSNQHQSYNAGAMSPKGYNPQQQQLSGAMSPKNYSSHQQQQQQVSNTQSSSANDFGEFESASNKGSAAAAATTANSQWGDLGKLVDLSGIAKNENKAAKAAAAASSYSAASFKGLDGFSKSSPQSNNMSNAPNPYNSGGGSSPMMYATQQQQPAMLVRQPSGMMASAGMPPQQNMGMSAMYPSQPPMVPQQMAPMSYGAGMQQQQQPMMGMGMQQQPMMMMQPQQQTMMAPNGGGGGYGMNNNMPPPQGYQPPRGGVMPGSGGW